MLSQWLPPASHPAANTPTAPMHGAMRSRPGGNSRWVSSRSCGARSMPVIAATRAERCSASAAWPDTPALRRNTETSSTADAASAVPTDAMSRNASGSMTNRPT